MSELSDRLRELRGPTSQTEMARQLGVQRTQWIRYENGQNSPSAEMIVKICRAHACSADWLLGLDDKSSARQNISVRAEPGSMAINVSNNKIGGAVGPIPINGATPPTCRTCPHLKKLRQLEKVFNKE